jgi:ribosomal protein S16
MSKVTSQRNGTVMAIIGNFQPKCAEMNEKNRVRTSKQFPVFQMVWLLTGNADRFFVEHVFSTPFTFVSSFYF